MQSVDLAKDTAERQLRAYLNRRRAFAGYMANFGEGEGGRNYRLRCRVTNVGLTPAYDVVAFGVASLRPAGNAPAFGEPLDKLATSKTVLGPGQSVDMILPTELIDRQTADEVERGTFRYFLVGEIAYRDAFDHTHYLRFVEEVAIERHGPLSISIEHYNDSD